MCGNAVMRGNSTMHDNSTMRGNSRMFGNSAMYDNSEIRNNAEMRDNSRTLDSSKIHSGTLYGVLFGDIGLNNQSQIKTITNIGSDNAKLTIVKFKDTFYLSAGSFRGTLEEFESKAKEESNTHYDNIRAIISLLFNVEL
jgi:hypothetical protein